MRAVSRLYDVPVPGGAVVFVTLIPTSTSGRKAIIIDGYGDVVGYTQRHGNMRYEPIVCIDEECICLPHVPTRADALGDVIRYLVSVNDERIDLEMMRPITYDASYAQEASWQI